MYIPQKDGPCFSLEFSNLDRSWGRFHPWMQVGMKLLYIRTYQVSVVQTLLNGSTVDGTSSGSLTVSSI